MNANILLSGWNVLKGKFKQTWALVTGDTLMFREGRTDEYLGHMQKKAREKLAAIERALRECEELRMQTDEFAKCRSYSARHARPLDVQRKEAWCLL